METRIETISPQTAAQYLELNLHANRKIRKSLVDNLVKALRDGEWKITHQGIAFDTNGRLIDGQHRMKAIAISGCVVKCSVTRGVDPNTFDVLDIGAKRNLADSLHIDRRVAEAIRFIGGTLVWHSSTFTPQKGSVLLDKFGRELYDIVNYCGTSRKVMSQASIKAALLVRILQNPQNKSDYLDLYRNLVLADFELLPPIGLAAFRMVLREGMVNGAGHALVWFSRGLKMFDVESFGLTKIIVRNETEKRKEAVRYLRRLVLET